MDQLLSEQYANDLDGVLSCYDRIVITGSFGELVKRCRLFRGDNFRSRPRIDRIVRDIG